MNMSLFHMCMMYMMCMKFTDCELFDCQRTNPIAAQADGHPTNPKPGSVGTPVRQNGIVQSCL